MAASAKVTHHDWKPGEKAQHSARNDIRSLELSLRVLRNRNPRFGKRGPFGNVRELAEIERLEALLEARRDDLARLTQD